MSRITSFNERKYAVSEWAKLTKENLQSSLWLEIVDNTHMNFNNNVWLYVKDKSDFITMMATN